MLPACLTRPCPWCGDRVIVPPAMPLRELAAHLEVRCRSCRGGVRALTSWPSFAAFIAGLGGGGTLLAVAMRTCNDVVIASSHAKQIALIAGAAFVVIMLVSWWFLVAATSVAPGARPR